MPARRVTPSPRSTVPPERRPELIATLCEQVDRFQRVLDDLVPARSVVASPVARATRAAGRAAAAAGRLRPKVDEAERTGSPHPTPPAGALLELLRAEDAALHRSLRTLYVQFDRTVTFVAGGIAGAGVTRGERGGAVAAAVGGAVRAADVGAMAKRVVLSAGKAALTKGASVLTDVATATSAHAARNLGVEGARAALGAGGKAGAADLGKTAGALSEQLRVLESLTPAQAAARAIADLGDPSLDVDLLGASGRLRRAWDAGFELRPTVRALFAERVAEILARLDAWASGRPTLSGPAAARAVVIPASVPEDVAAAGLAFASYEDNEPRVIEVRVTLSWHQGRWPEFRELVGDLVHDPDVEHVLRLAAGEVPREADPAQFAYLTRHVSRSVSEAACERLRVPYSTVNGAMPV